MDNTKQQEIMRLLDLHPELYDRILRLLIEKVSDPATTREHPEEAD